MTVEYALHDSVTGIEYTLPSNRLEDSSLGFERTIRLARPPGISSGYTRGDGKAKPTAITLRFTIVATLIEDAATIAEDILERADIATSVVRRVESGRSVGEHLTAWRAVNALKSLELEQVEGLPRLFGVRLQFLPTFGRATVNRAETSGEYDAATKTVTGGVWGG